jgi:cyclic pyranopterin phosphate synthase
VLNNPLNHPVLPANLLPAGADALQDGFGRKINYLRLSVTDRCDFRCAYCMSDKVAFVPKNEILSLEECLFIARTFVAMGVTKIRLSGGEPLVRKNFIWLVARLRELEGLKELTLTTNGSQLGGLAFPLAQAGLNRVNVSLDTLDAETFRRITRTGDLNQVLGGIDAAIAAFGPRSVKLNTVMMRDANHAELPALLAYALSRGIDISFIEQMPLGLTEHDHAASFFSSADARAELAQFHELLPSPDNTGGPARYWRIPGRASRIGFISPHSQNFCASCNRVRVTARGELFPCLGQENMTDLLPAVRRQDEEALRALTLKTVVGKPVAHGFDLPQDNPRIVRFMSHTGG